MPAVPPGLNCLFKVAIVYPMNWPATYPFVGPVPAPGGANTFTRA